MPLYLALKNIFSRKSSFAIILFIAFAVSLLVVSNALFDGTGQGIEKTFVESFTGDIVIRPKVSFPLSLMGDETPSTGSFSEIPQIVPYSKILLEVESSENIESVIPQISAQAVINTNGIHSVCVAFGVDASLYIRNMPGIILEDGRVFETGEKGILLSKTMIKEIEEKTGVLYNVGDSVQLLCGNGISYSLRAVTLTGIYSYKIENDVLGKICLASPEVLRQIMGISQTSEDSSEIDFEQNDLIVNTKDFEIDDLFGTDCDIENLNFYEESYSNELIVEDEKDFSEMDSGNITSWNFLVCKVKEGKNPSIVAKRMNRLFSKNGWEIEAVTWRSAAGLSAMYLFWMHNIFTFGVIVLLAVGFIIVNNTLTVSALDRIAEIGTLRAIGGKKNFIILQFICETSFLTLLAGVLGFGLGCVFNFLINIANISFSNTYLIQIFGGSTLKITITISNFIKCIGLSIVLGIIGWIYPVKISLDVSPVQAMQRGL